MTPVFSATSDQLNVWLVAFFWPFVRMLALVGTAPLFSEKAVSRTIKVSLAGLMAIAIAPTLGPLPQVPLVSAAGVLGVFATLWLAKGVGFVHGMWAKTMLVGRFEGAPTTTGPSVSAGGEL